MDGGMFGGLEVEGGVGAGTESDASVCTGAVNSASSSESQRSAQLFLPLLGELNFGVGEETGADVGEGGGAVVDVVMEFWFEVRGGPDVGRGGRVAS